MVIHWVSTTGSDDTGDGSRQSPYRTVEKALSVFQSQDQIRIMDGTYTPPDSVVVQGMEGSIFAENPGSVYIQPEKTRAHVACVAIVDSPRFLLAGINVLQAADSSGNLIGIYAGNSENFVCLTCEVSDFQVPSGVGKGIFASGSGRVERCKVMNFAGAGTVVYGIHLMGLDAIECSVSALSGVFKTVPLKTEALV